MDIKMNRNDKELVIALGGRLDTVTSPELDAALKGALDGVEKLIFDLTDLAYISSAGLRILLGTAQIMDDQGEMVIKNVTQPVRDVFKVTNLLNEFKIEE